MQGRTVKCGVNGWGLGGGGLMLMVCYTRCPLQGRGKLLWVPGGTPDVQQCGACADGEGGGRRPNYLEE